MASILYNNSDPFSGLSAVPLVTFSKENLSYGKKWGEMQSLSLEGTVTLNDTQTNQFAAAVAAKDLLIERFSTQFKTLEIKDDENDVIYSGICYVRSVVFDESKFYNFLPYTINLDVYQQLSANGIIDPSESIEFQQGEDCVVTVSRTISATGVNTNTLAYTNVKSFVAGIAASPISVVPLNIPNPTALVLTSWAEKGSALDATYSITTTYTGSENANYFIRYTFDITNNEDAIVVSVKGVITGKMGYPIESLRADLKALNLYAEAENFYDDYSGIPLNTDFLTASYTENSNEVTISFDYSWDNSVLPNPYNFTDVTLETGVFAQSYCLDLSRQIKAKGNCVAGNLLLLETEFAAQNQLDILDEYWDEYVGDIIPHGSPLSSSLSKNTFEPSISWGSRICKTDGYDTDCLKNFKVTFDGELSINVFRSMDIPYQTCHVIFDIGTKKRARFLVNGTAQKKECCSLETAREELIDKINEIVAAEFAASDKILEDSNIQEENGLFSFRFAFSGEGAEFVL